MKEYTKGDLDLLIEECEDVNIDKHDVIITKPSINIVADRLSFHIKKGGGKAFPLYELLIDPYIILHGIEETITSIKNSDASRKSKERRLAKYEDKAVMHEQVSQKLKAFIENGVYTPEDYHKFTLVERGKERMIESCRDPIDRVVLKILTMILSFFINRTIYEYSLCNIKGRGIAKGVKRVKSIFNKEKRRYYAYKNKGWEYYPANAYVLKMDVRHYYENIDRGILRSKLSRLLKCKKLVDLVFCFVKKYSKGLGLGGGMCAILANFYLRELDYEIVSMVKKKNKNKIKDRNGRMHFEPPRKRQRGGYYLRYMDDMVVMSTNKDNLRKVLKHVKEKLKELKLELKQNYYIEPLCPRKALNDMSNENLKKYRRLDFLGFTFGPKNVHIRKRIRKKIIRKLRRLKRRGFNRISLKDVQSLISTYGFVKMSDSQYLYKKYVGIPNLHEYLRIVLFIKNTCGDDFEIARRILHSKRKKKSFSKKAIEYICKKFILAKEKFYKLYLKISVK